MLLRKLNYIVTAHKPFCCGLRLKPEIISPGTVRVMLAKDVIFIVIHMFLSTAVLL